MTEFPTRRAPAPGVLRRGVRTAAVALAAMVLTVPTGLGAQQEMTFPGERWEEVSPRDLAAYGWNADALRNLWEAVRDNTPITGLVVADRGRVVMDFGDVADLSYVASVRKSVLAMLYGTFVEDGTIDLDATLSDLGMDDVGGLLDIEKRARVLDLITARSGVYHPASNSGDNLADAPERGSQEPGTYMLYSNWDFNAAGAAFERTTGRDIYDELERQIAGPIGFEDWDRSLQRKSGDLTVSVNPAYHMWISTRDMARIGHLMLNHGEWDGRQVIPREWADRIVSTVTPLEEMNPVSRRDEYFGYGYMWWTFDGPDATGPFEGAYTARGAWGQWITVLPALDMVVAVKTNSVYGRTTSWESWHRLLERLLAARGVRVERFPWAR